VTLRPVGALSLKLLKLLRSFKNNALARCLIVENASLGAVLAEFDLFQPAPGDEGSTAFKRQPADVGGEKSR
jgi:hypothetical protein